MSTTIDLLQAREFFASEIQAVASLKTAALIDALRVVPRERFLRAGPWTVQADLTGPRQTADDDPRHVYHNLSVAIDPGRQLFNGNPSLIAGLIDGLALAPGSRVLHIGAGLGYYTALIGHVVGAAGRVLAIEVDEALAAEARANLGSMPWIEVQTGDATAVPDESFDAILVNAGVTHPQERWLDALAPGGRLVLPLTATIAAMGTIGKGVVMTFTRRGESRDLDGRALTFIAIYSGIGLRDDEMNMKLGQALMRTPFPPVKRLRRDAHDPSPQCWLHGERFCMSMSGAAA